MNQKVTTNQLAIMIAKGFSEVDKKIDRVHQDLSQRIDHVDQEIFNVKQDINDFQAAKANYVYEIDHNRLVHRVEVLEDKIL